MIKKTIRIMRGIWKMLWMKKLGRLIVFQTPIAPALRAKQTPLHA
jgi:hypothetical protein